MKGMKPPPPFLNFLYRPLIPSRARPKRSHQRPVLKNPQSEYSDFRYCCAKNQGYCTYRLQLEGSNSPTSHWFWRRKLHVHSEPWQLALVLSLTNQTHP